MIDLYTWKTPNGRKVSIMLEELGAPYTVHPVDIGANAQFAPDFLAISPNNKIPAIVDRDTGVSVFESGAILIYLAEKFNVALLPSEPAARAQALSWLFFQVGGVGPMFGQYGHFHVYAREDVPYAKKRYADETARLIGVMDKRLADAPYLAGDYSVADIASYAWTLWAFDRLAAEDGAFAADHAHVRDWLARIGERPAVQRGLAIPR
ncbi:MAG: glutathione S-transferase N-terminal domain-containing protein [Pseudomonadota bacterium]